MLRRTFAKLLSSFALAAGLPLMQPDFEKGPTIIDESENRLAQVIADDAEWLLSRGYVTHRVVCNRDTWGNREIKNRWQWVG